MDDNNSNAWRRSIVVGVFLIAIATSLTAETSLGTYRSQDLDFRVVEVTGDLSRPWGMAFLPDGSVLITERTGDLVLLSDGVKTRVEGVPQVASVGQGGLLDIALHPDFASNRLVYLTYSDSYRLGYGTKVGRGVLDGTRLEGFEEIFVLGRSTRTSHHFGSRMTFDSDGYLYVSLGDRGARDRAQDLGDHAGSILRLNDDGSVPPDNPFVGRSDVEPEIYSYGHRNIQGMVFDSTTGVLWAHEHGPKGGDEVNTIKPGLNYGWPEVTFGREYSGGYIAPSEGEGFEPPVIHWTPSIAPSGFAVYRGNRIPEWRGDLFAGALAGQHLRRMIVEDGEIVSQEVLLENTLGRIRDVREGPDGHLWLLIDSASGSLLKIEPVGRAE